MHLSIIAYIQEKPVENKRRKHLKAYLEFSSGYCVKDVSISYRQLGSLL